MSSEFANCSLLLCPADASANTDSLTTLISQLADTGLIAGPVDDQYNGFYVGDDYLKLVSYMGCAPSIQFEPGESNDRFCHIRLHRYDRPVLKYSRKQSRKPRCPHCNQNMKAWSFDPNHQFEETITCPLCGKPSATETFGWQKMAGFARLFIEITDIFPKEAIPQPELLNQLARVTGFRWQYFYCCL